ncbi:hypothetical protein [Thauera chlorobenzoica]|uniref:hypothetical protein n=1 Tax=Thauera chlorobenzoica TaxID=96773 RepID=UPI00089FD6EB|nr:hypothetical protein [Thauera chlorobenzoica]SEF91186.1 hypothetical protein SAMN05216242_10996 [Thauera chlorobenzoica]
MKICLYGAGAVGARIAAAGHPLSVVKPGTALAALRVAPQGGFEAPFRWRTT